MTSNSAISLMWPTTLAGVIAAVVLAFAVLAGPADADSTPVTPGLSVHVPG